MREQFAEVLSREGRSLAGIGDTGELAEWRRQVIRELLDPKSTYAAALTHAPDAPDRCEFLSGWRRLIAEMVERVWASRSAATAEGLAPGCMSPAFDPNEHAVLILAALHGGSALSRVTRDPRALSDALDLALAPLTGRPGGVPHDE